MVSQLTSEDYKQLKLLVTSPQLYLPERIHEYKNDSDIQIHYPNQSPVHLIANESTCSSLSPPSRKTCYENVVIKTQPNDSNYLSNYYHTRYSYENMEHINFNNKPQNPYRYAPQRSVPPPRGPPPAYPPRSATSRQLYQQVYNSSLSVTNIKDSSMPRKEGSMCRRDGSMKHLQSAAPRDGSLRPGQDGYPQSAPAGLHTDPLGQYVAQNNLQIHPNGHVQSNGHAFQKQISSNSDHTVTGHMTSSNLEKLYQVPRYYFCIALTTCIVCPPCGCWSLYQAFRVDDYVDLGNFKDAKRLARKVKVYSFIMIFVGLFWILLVVGLFLFMMQNFESK